MRFILALTLPACALAFQCVSSPLKGAIATAHSRPAQLLKMQQQEQLQVEYSAQEAPAAEAQNERFIAISLKSLDKWAEKYPRLKPKLKDIQMAALIFPFKASPYLVEELIDWEMEGDIAKDPFYRLVFPTMDMLSKEHRAMLEEASEAGDPFKLKEVVDAIREDLNPHPAGQKELNAPKRKDLSGVQHKYAETVLFFAAAAQTCHAYCT